MSQPPIKLGSRVEVTWMDAAFEQGWGAIGTLVDVSTCGYLVQQDDVIKVALNIDENGYYGEVMTIPTSTVKKVKVLR